MGYRIVYGEEAAEKPQPQSRLRVMTAGFALALVVLTRLFWPAGTAALQQVLLPGEDAAFVRLREDLQAGESISDAVTVYCRSIVEEALGEAD